MTDPDQTSIDKKKQFSGWLAWIDSRTQAKSMVKECAIVLFFLAVLQAVLAIAQGPSLLPAVGVWTIAGLLLWRRASRFAAVLLLLSSLVFVALTLANKSGADFGGGSNVMLALALLWVSIKSVEASFRLRGRYALPQEAQTTESNDQPAANA